MKPIRKTVGVLVIAAAATASGFIGFNVFQDAKFAWAEQKVEATREQLAHVEDLATVFRHVGKVVEPSVVNINVKKTIHGARQLPFDDNMLRRFFPDRDGDGEPDLPPGFDESQGGDRVQMGTGSGVIMEVDGDFGYIVTNNHVAGGATEMDITLNDGREIKDATLVGADPKSDIAVVKIKANHLIAAKWGNSDELQKGDWVMAFGSPFGYVGSMTHGIVSALNRTNVGILGAQGYEDFIQVDAPINPGNSGGPLVNIRGEVVGINTAIASRSGGFQGIGFAIPSNQAKKIFESLKAHGKVSRGWLGVSISDVKRNKDLARSFGYKSDKGVLVQQTFNNTPASGKLQAGDIIMQLDGKEIPSVQELRTAIAQTSPGETVKLHIYRDGKESDVSIKLGDQPADLMAVASGKASPGASGQAEGANQSAASVGLQLTDVNAVFIKRFGLPAGTTGALVSGVERGSVAAEEGLRPGDVITRINDQEVGNAEDASNALAKSDLGKGVRMYVTSREGSRFVFVKVEKNAKDKGE